MFLRRLLVVVALVVSAACTEPEATVEPRAASASSSPASPTATETPSPSRTATHPIFTDETFELAPEDTPYPYTTPIPPPIRTPVDGTYLRILTIDDAGGLLPFRCLRCPPYFVNAGVSTIALSKGNYWINHQLSDFRALGMYTVEGDRITFFNDPWCPTDRGVYRWDLAGGEIRFEAISGTCDYEEARAKDLATGPWVRIKPCIYLIEHLWPGPVAC